MRRVIPRKVTGATPVADLTPVTMELLPVEVDFGASVTSVQDLQGGTPVHLQLSIETDEMAEPGQWDIPAEYTGDLRVVESTLTESAILLTNANAWVVIHGTSELDNYLQG